MIDRSRFYPKFQPIHQKHQNNAAVYRQESAQSLRFRLFILLGLAFMLLVGLASLSRVEASTGLNVREGQVAPDFTLLDQNGEAVRLIDQRGKWVVLYFYPKDDTPGCTKEACSFRDNILGIQRLNATVLGVSVDTVSSHKKFSDKHKLNFQILADDQFKVTESYGVLIKFMSEQYANRSTVIIDPAGKIRKIFPSVRPENHAIEVHKTLKDFQK